MVYYRYTRATRALSDGVTSTWNSFLNWISSLFDSQKAPPPSLRGRAHSQQDETLAVAPAEQEAQEVVLEDEAAPQEPALVLAPEAAGSDAEPEPLHLPLPPVEARPLDPLEELAPFQAVDMGSFTRAQLALFFQELGIRESDRGGVANSLREILEPKFEQLWRRCITAVQGKYDPEGYESVARGLQNLRRAFANHPRLRLILGSDLKQRYDSLKHGNLGYRLYRGGINEAWTDLASRHLSRRQ